MQRLEQLLEQYDIKGQQHTHKKISLSKTDVCHLRLALEVEPGPGPPGRLLPRQ